MDVRLSHDGPSPNKNVHINAWVQMPDGQKGVRVASGTVNRRGVFSVRRPLWRISWLWAQWNGDRDAHNCIATEYQKVDVRAAVEGRMKRPRKDDRGIPTYAPGASPRYVSSVVPPHPVDPLEIHVEENRGTSWAPIQQGIVAAGKRSVFKISAGLLGRGGQYRVRGVTQAHNDHLAGHSSWSYFEVRR
jgi:hypothetical protein